MRDGPSIGASARSCDPSSSNWPSASLAFLSPSGLSVRRVGAATGACLKAPLVAHQSVSTRKV